MEDCKILTQNVYFAPVKQRLKRFKEVSRHIRENEYDVAFLQEAMFYPDVLSFKNDHNMAYKGGLWGPKGGLITLLKDKPDSVEFHKFKDQGRLRGTQLSDRLLGKGFLVARQGDMSYVNSHLVAVYSQDPEKRKEEHQHVSNQAEELIEFLTEEVKDKKVVAAGDFNFNPKSENYAKIVETLTDHTTPLKGEIDFDDDEGQLDFVFSNSEASSGHEVVEYNRWVSDHDGVALELKF